jgi:uncharacterized C2H2 Zn-finger protein
MIELIRTFWSKIRGRGKVVVVEGLIYKCTKCHLIFLTKNEGERHVSQDHC